MEGIAIKAIFSQARTTIDGGWKITFDVSADEAAKVVQISELKDHLLMLGIVIAGNTNE